MTDVPRDPPPEPAVDATGGDAGREPPASAAKPAPEPQVAHRKTVPQANPAGPPVRAPHRSGGWIAGLLALVALAASGYTLYRIDAARDRLDAFRDDLQSLESGLSALRTELEGLGARHEASSREMAGQLDALRTVPREIETLRVTLAELQSRADLPQQSWSRTEARVLLDLAQRRLTLDRDIATASAALAAADAVLADLNDPALAAVREQIARDREALQAVPQPDRRALAQRLALAEQRTSTLPLAATVVGEPNGTAQPQLPEGGLARAWALLRNAFSNLVTVRREGDADTILSADLAAIRRQHLALLLFSARTALVRGDEAAFQAALSGAADWLDRYFATQEPEVSALLDELRALADIDVAPQLPDVSQAARLLVDVPAGNVEAP